MKKKIFTQEKIADEMKGILTQKKKNNNNVQVENSTPPPKLF